MERLTLKKLHASSASDGGDNDDDSRGDRRSNAGDGRDDGNNHSDDGSGDDDNGRTKLPLEPRCRLRLRRQHLTSQQFSLKFA